MAGLCPAINLKEFEQITASKLAILLFKEIEAAC